MEWVDIMKDGVKWSFCCEEIQDFRFFPNFLSVFGLISIENWKAQWGCQMTSNWAEIISVNFL